jgi:vesicle transport through interaction with t-SNAREs 1
MSHPMDSEAGAEQFDNYEAELKLVEADLTQKLDQVDELSGEERKAAIRGAERAVEEAKELVRISLHLSPAFPLYEATTNLPPSLTK